MGYRSRVKHRVACSSRATRFLQPSTTETTTSRCSGTARSGNEKMGGSLIMHGEPNWRCSTYNPGECALSRAGSSVPLLPVVNVDKHNHLSPPSKLTTIVIVADAAILWRVRKPKQHRTVGQDCDQAAVGKRKAHRGQQRGGEMLRTRNLRLEEREGRFPPRKCNEGQGGGNALLETRLGQLN